MILKQGGSLIQYDQENVDPGMHIGRMPGEVWHCAATKELPKAKRQWGMDPFLFSYSQGEHGLLWY